MKFSKIQKKYEFRVWPVEKPLSETSGILKECKSYHFYSLKQKKISRSKRVVLYQMHYLEDSI